MCGDVGVERSCVYFESHLFVWALFVLGGCLGHLLMLFQVLESLVDPGVEVKGREGNVCN